MTRKNVSNAQANANGDTSSRARYRSRTGSRTGSSSLGGRVAAEAPVQRLDRVELGPGGEPRLDKLSSLARGRLDELTIIDHSQHRRGESRHVARREQEPGLAVDHQLGVTLEVAGDHRGLDGESLAQRAGDAQARVRSVHTAVAPGEDLGHVVAIAEDEQPVPHAPQGGAVVEGARIPGADHEQTREGPARGREGERIDRVVVALPASHADLRTEKILGTQ